MLYTGARGRKQKNPKVSVLKEEIGHFLHTGHHEAPTPGKPKRCLYVLYSCILENLVAVQSVLMLLVPVMLKCSLFYRDFGLKTSRSDTDHAMMT